MKCRLLPLLLFALAACGAFPRDPEETLRTIERDHLIRVGLVADPHPIDDGRARALIGMVERQTQARAQIETGATEPLLMKLDRGELDMVIGPVSKDTPWRTDVALGPPLAIRGTKDDRTELVAAMRNGENRWIMLVERASRAVAPEASGR